MGGKRAVLEHTNLKTGAKTTYYVHQAFFVSACIYFIAALYFSTSELFLSITFFMIGVFLVWSAIDIKEEDGEAPEK